MELEYESECEFNVTEQKELIKILSFKNIVGTIILVAFMFVIGIISLISIVNGYNSVKLVIGFVSIICGIAYIILGFYNYMKALKQVKNDVKYSYQFYDDRILVAYIAANGNANQTFRYEELKKCVKKEKYTLLYVEKNRAIPIKNEFMSEELYSFLKTKIR